MMQELLSALIILKITDALTTTDLGRLHHIIYQYKPEKIIHLFKMCKHMHQHHFLFLFQIPIAARNHNGIFPPHKQLR